MLDLLHRIADEVYLLNGAGAPEATEALKESDDAVVPVAEPAGA
jgi:hypothetical protein